MARYNIHWTIATDPTYYGPDATEEDARRCAAREAKEVTAYVYREFPGNLIETHLVPETVSFRYQSWIEDEAGREYQDTDPTGILEAIGEFVTSHWTDWLEIGKLEHLIEHQEDYLDCEDCDESNSGDACEPVVVYATGYVYW